MKMVLKAHWKWTTLLVRLFHTSLTIGVAASLLFTETSLKRALFYHENLIFAICFLAVLLFTLTMYWTACLCDPGFVPIEVRSVSETDDEASDLTLESARMLSNGVRLRKCGFCDIEQPLRAQHCEDCDRCVRRYDHHCPWLDTCVGEKNHRFFWFFLLSKSTLIVWSAYIVWHSYASKDSWEEWLQHNIVFVIDTFILLLAGFVVVCLTGVHTYLMLTGTTTWELMARDRITYLSKLKSYDYNPFHEGYYKNVFHFLCRLGIRQWDKMYNRKVSKKRNSFSKNDSEENEITLEMKSTEISQIENI